MKFWRWMTTRWPHWITSLLNITTGFFQLIAIRWCFMRYWFRKIMERMWDGDTFALHAVIAWWRRSWSRMMISIDWNWWLLIWLQSIRKDIIPPERRIRQNAWIVVTGMCVRDLHGLFLLHLSVMDGNNVVIVKWCSINTYVKRLLKCIGKRVNESEKQEKE